MNKENKVSATVGSHTPGPWSNNGCQITAQGDMRLIVAVALSESDVLASRYSGHAAKTQADGIANAQFIVRACNCHDELLETLERATEKLMWLNYDDTRLVERCRAAIAKAKGES